ncbi:MAG: pyruvate, phosphate dikinase [Candidatus Raymondbacteria bacterium RifOxyA12_full_50_37]|nr:MAG: pyruvate, phosphate dikinase [Candidatus Raymondbacteria bacterium RifOxyA12_full_50_37]OGJ93826.1 MAG: pyruvate, phosphate dikinase [Candidatus Raymondbacteria bacterium RIFOXYA2_FULL_49_16]OGJ98307.1 MAG: pyruvate, phosphate dikinase [Candidatus Raymondbacteria bacterium RIFOXYC2_FULL_50_21]OGK04087.1 MAG: pyruvate, phosphate dikinase [Candidatus Raymondbacteria bacterium RifOxyB12_full_50_8]OGP45330.1 MAG: pyruvate, phosphate dikinase [Candidatus Raymondbacteria bacterium RIFOXYB2_FU
MATKKAAKKKVKKPAKAKSAKYVYFFGGGRADGNESMKNLLGGKGANLAEMAGHKSLRLPVPPGFTITTELCTYYYDHKKTFPNELKAQVNTALANVEKLMGKKFGDTKNPLLVSVRSGARKSMPGMMDTVLNVGLNDETIQGVIALTGNPRFAYDAYRRLVMMYADVVMEKAEGIVPKNGKGIRKVLDERLDQVKHSKGYKSDTDLTAEELKAMVADFKQIVLDVLGKPFPEKPEDQLWGGIAAVFASWNGKRAIEYRRIEHIPDEWGTAVNVQSMVFGNMGDDSATGVAFTRNPGNGEGHFYGEYLINAQGEDVVAGIRTPSPINDYSKNDQSRDLPTLQEIMPAAFKQLNDIQKRLEKHYRDMQDIEFTIEKGTLYMLQCRVGKRNGVAAVRMATDMYKEKLIDAKTAVSRVQPGQLVELLLPMIDPKAELATRPVAKGLPAGPGGAKGRAVFSSDDAVAWASRGEKVIMVREETSPEDVDGMHKSQAILTTKGGMTSHAALVARGWGKCCIVGCSEIEVGSDGKSFHTKNGTVIREGDMITLNGTKGLVYQGGLDLVDVDIEHNQAYVELMKLVDKIRVLKVRTNADTPKDTKKAIQFGAEGIGLFRTEHMFYGEGSDKPLFLLRKMIMSKGVAERRAALNELFPFVKNDVKATMEALDGYPITIRLLDPPLHEFVPHNEEKLAQLGAELQISKEELTKRADGLRENNPMLGHRGVRLGVTYPEISEMQIRAILEAAGELIKAGKKAFPEIMIPVTCSVTELNDQKAIVEKVYKEVCEKVGLKKIPYMFGTMIEIPRAALTANKMAETAEFFSFGTNDLTQMGFGFSRDDIGSFLPDYLEKKVLPADPFATIDQEGIGELITFGINRGRKTRPNLKVGICGEHGGDPESVVFCHKVGMNYVSCSPFRVPIARLAAAHAALQDKKK